MGELTLEQRAMNYETMKHIEMVRNLLGIIHAELIVRAELHDQSKLVPPEVEIFTEFTPQLRKTTYGSEEYMSNLEKMKPAVDHHNANNRHHPEYHLNGIDDMNLVDLVEMFCDWMAATKRHADGDIRKSIEVNKERFNMSPQLVQIFKNTIPVLSDTVEELCEYCMIKNSGRSE